MQHEFDVAVGLVEAEETLDAAAAVAAQTKGTSPRSSNAAVPGHDRNGKGGGKSRLIKAGQGRGGLAVGRGAAGKVRGRNAKKDMNWRKGRGVFK